MEIIRESLIRELRFEDLLQNWTVMSRSDLQANGFNVEAYDLMLHGYTANNVATFSYLGMDGEFSIFLLLRQTLVYSIMTVP